MDIMNSVYLPITVIVFTFIVSYCTKVEILRKRRNNIFYSGKYEKRMLFIWCIAMLCLLFY